MKMRSSASFSTGIGFYNWILAAGVIFEALTMVGVLATDLVDFVMRFLSARIFRVPGEET